MERRSVLKTLVTAVTSVWLAGFAKVRAAFAWMVPQDQGPQAQTLVAQHEATEESTVSAATYRNVLRRVRDTFPRPVADPVRDAVFVRQVDQSIALLNAMKSQRLYLGTRKPLDYARARQAVVPEQMATTEAAVADLAPYLEGMIIWSHPDTHRLHGSATAASIIGQLYGALYDPNLVWDDLSYGVAEAEVAVSAMCADLVGYDPKKAGGIFTFGGTGTTLYGVKVGLEKAQPGAFREGVRSPLKVVASDVSHYAKLSAAAWLGLGTEAVIAVPSHPDNSIDLAALEKTLRNQLARGERIAALVVTMGTTDSFGVDDIAGVVVLRDRLVAEYRLPYKPHVHADAVIGWIFTVFNDYNFTENPLQLPVPVREALRQIRERMKSLHLADSIGMDFHKSGYSPYMSSLFLCHPGVYTLECSRSGGPVLAALANLKLLGKDGFRTIIGHGVDMAERLRTHLAHTPHTVILNDQNHGLSVVFRCYPEGVNAAAAYQEERSDKASSARLKATNDYNARVYTATRQLVDEGDGAVFVRTDEYRLTSYGEAILGIKCFMFSVFTDETAVDKAIACIEKARRVVAEADRRHT
jgi:L-2,4-diaminobutyrate decarboxylase